MPRQFFYFDNPYIESIFITVDVPFFNPRPTVNMQVDPCEEDPGIVGQNGDTYYKRNTPLDSKSIKFILKAFTTETASTFMLKTKFDFHWKLMKQMSDELEDRSLGTMYMKGGLALHLALTDTMKEARRGKTTDEYNRLKSIDAYIASRYASPSDLDTGVYVHDLDKLDEVKVLLKSLVDTARHEFTGCKTMLKSIVEACNANKDYVLNKLDPELGFIGIDFVDQCQNDQLVTLSTSDPDCPYPECVVVSTKGKHCLFKSENETLEFEKGNNLADFYLLRVKWSIAAVLTRTDGTTCTSVCPAELLDVAIRRKNDSRITKSQDKGMHAMHKYITIDTTAGDIIVPAVSLYYQLLDLQEMILESRQDMLDTKEVKDTKIGKRIYRFFILMVLRDTNRDEALYERPDSWRTLLQAHNKTNVSTICDFMDDLVGKNIMEEDQTLFEALSDYRIIVNNSSQWGGKHTLSTSMAASVMCAATTFVMAVLGSLQ